jgi:acetyl-CoA carboxylase, biotin carboxylase subunit
MPHPAIKKVLVANRGEIALRVIRGAKELGCQTVAIYSEADVLSPHVLIADEAYCVGPAPSSESYLKDDLILKIAIESGVTAIHPGYGFLSENAAFAQKVIDKGLTWIGPPPSAIHAMGSKTESRQRMVDAGVPVVPGTTTPILSIQDAVSIAEDMGYPIMLKAAAGGGGKGMREVNSTDELAEAYERSRSEAIASFGNGDIYIEKRIIEPRHVEVQILADQHGTVVHLFERDCSIQRRHQKVIEEAPCPVLLESTRQQMTKIAIQAAAAVDYVGAGTIEFLLENDQSFYFLEMNTRLQVEHPISEMITGIDLVQAQLRIAAGEPLWFEQKDIHSSGHAIECRIYAESPFDNWRPSPGPLRHYKEPSGPWIRVDSGVVDGGEVSVYYDPMIAKLIVWGSDRKSAIQRMLSALKQYEIIGIQSTIPFFIELLGDDDFLKADYNTGYLNAEKMKVLEPQSTETLGDLEAMLMSLVKYNSESSKKPTAESSDTGQSSRWKWSLR